MYMTPNFDRGQTREICGKQEKFFKGNVVTFTVQRLILYQYPVDLLTFLGLYKNKSSKYFKMGKFGFVAPLLPKQLGADCGAFKSKPVYVGKMKYIYTQQLLYISLLYTVSTSM